METGIYFDKKTIQMLDDFAERKALSRSSAVRFCVRTYLETVRDGI